MEVTDAQIRKIHTILTKHGINNETYRMILKAKFHVDSSRELNEEEASRLIEHLIEITGDTYDRDNNTEYYQRKMQEQYIKELYGECVAENSDLIKDTIINFAKGYDTQGLLKIIFEETTRGTKHKNFAQIN